MGSAIANFGRLGRYLAQGKGPTGWTEDALLTAFLEYLDGLNLVLYPAQETAILEAFANKNVILNTPTGSGKSLVATALHFKAVAENKRSFYTCPIKALVSEKFFALCHEFGPDYVGMMTGDATVNRDAPIICCTAEILSNIALREGASAAVDYVIMDELHYYSDRDRGAAWQIPLLTLPQAKFLLMSATLGNTDFFERCLSELTGSETVAVRSMERPVPLDFEYRETPVHETVLHLIKTGRAPIYIVHFTQRGCAEEAQNLMSHDYCTRDEKRAIQEALAGELWASPYGREFQKFLRHGIGIHHAGLLPKYRLLVEKLAQRGHLKIICGTDTLGVGVNIPIRTVLFTKLCKFDGEKTAILTARDFHQISGRAGRRGFDEQGSVVVQAPEHHIENLRLEAKAGDDPAKKRKIVKRKPPERGYVHWDRPTFDRLVVAQPEQLVSKFQVSHGMLLNVLSRPDGCKAMKRLLNDCHETKVQKRQHKRTALAMFRSLFAANILEFVPKEAGVGKRIAVHSDLQYDFSLNHTLSLYLLNTLPLLDPDADTHALDVLTLVESILEDPDPILNSQLDRIKTEKLAEMKAAGVEYDDRMEELAKLEYPKPNREFIYETFNAFAKNHPWIGQANIRPKSIAREMLETYQSFAEYVKEYGLQRVEGLLLRYLSDVYKVLVQTVPERVKTQAIDDIVVFLGATVREVDSSLLDEWERMKNPELILDKAKKAGSEEDQKPDITRDARAFLVLVRNEIFRLLVAFASRDYLALLEMLAQDGEGEVWDKAKLEASLAGFYVEHTEIRTDPKARSPQNTVVRSKTDAYWDVEQVLSDWEENNDWVLCLRVDLERSRQLGKVVISLREIRS